MQLKQVFMNLLLNAVDAMPEGGTLILKTSFNEAPRAVTVVISDTGKGIDASVRDKIFQPFFTTKAKGTGLGLTVCQQIVALHGGSIELRSEPGVGTSVTVTLPQGGAEP